MPLLPLLLLPLLLLLLLVTLLVLALTPLLQTSRRWERAAALRAASGGGTASDLRVGRSVHISN